MIEHIIDDFENVELVQINAYGGCYLDCLATFLKLSVFQMLKNVCKDGWVSLAKLVLKEMAQEKFVCYFLELYRTQLGIAPAPGSGERPSGNDDNNESLLLDFDTTATSIVTESRVLLTKFAECTGTKKERKKFISQTLSSRWNVKFVEYFFPAISFLLNIEIVIWTVKAQRGRLEIQERFNPGKQLGSVNNPCIDTCNIVWCKTELNKAHFNLLNVTLQTKSTVNVIDLR